MTIVQLEYLLAVANYGSFSLASEHCFVTQPSLSTQIKNLEDELGVILLNRSQKPMGLTEAGKVVVKQANIAIADFYTIAEKIGNMKKEVKGIFRLGVIPTIAPYLLHKFVPSFVDKYPDVRIEIREMYTREIEAELKFGKIDAGLLAAGFTNAEEVKEDILFVDKFYLYHDKESPLKEFSEVHIADIDINSLILLPDGHCLRTQVVDLCKAHNRKNDKISFDSGSLETISRMVDSIGGVTILPEMAIELLSQTRKEQVKPFSPIINARRDIALAVSKNFYKTGIYNAIKEEIIKTNKI